MNLHRGVLPLNRCFFLLKKKKEADLDASLLYILFCARGLLIVQFLFAELALFVHSMFMWDNSKLQVIKCVCSTTTVNGSNKRLPH